MVCNGVSIKQKQAPKNGCYCRQTPKIKELAEYLFNYCSHCGCEFCKMMQQGAFSAFKVRENEEKLKKFREDPSGSENRGYNKHYPNAGLSPLQYNSKLMNSIWGMYNRYSVHNFKKNMDDGLNQQFQNADAKFIAARKDML